MQGACAHRVEARMRADPHSSDREFDEEVGDVLRDDGDGDGNPPDFPSLTARYAGSPCPTVSYAY
jgi:hypothetical protein